VKKPSTKSAARQRQADARRRSRAAVERSPAPPPTTVGFALRAAATRTTAAFDVLPRAPVSPTPRVPTSRAAIARAATWTATWDVGTADDDRRTLALLTLPVLAIVVAYGMTEAVKPGRHTGDLLLPPISGMLRPLPASDVAPAPPAAVAAVAAPTATGARPAPPAVSLALAAATTPHAPVMPTAATVTALAVAAPAARPGTIAPPHGLAPVAARPRPPVAAPSPTGAVGAARPTVAVAVARPRLPVTDIAAAATVAPRAADVATAVAAPVARGPVAVAAVAPAIVAPPRDLAALDVARSAGPLSRAVTAPPQEIGAAPVVAIAAVHTPPPVTAPSAAVPTPAPTPAIAALWTRELPTAGRGRTSICEASPGMFQPGALSPAATRPVLPPVPPAAVIGAALAAAARAQLDDLVIYDDRYRRLAYPMGDVAGLYGVCTDVVIRAYRAVGIDLQQLVHEAKAGRGDPNIDHRRTEVLRRFFEKHGQSLPVSSIGEDYRPGDVVTYHRPQNTSARSHIAIVSDVLSPSGRYMIVHNRGYGPQLEDALFVDEITGHYRYAGPQEAVRTAAPAAAERLPITRLDGRRVSGLGR
jgi:hypothetical protein